MATLPACPVCQKTQWLTDTYNCTDYISRQQFTVHPCQCTGSHFTEITADHNEEYYGTAYYNSDKGKFSPLIEQIFRWNHQRNADFFYQNFQPNKVLEIGCGRAYILQALKAKGCDVYCVESSQAAEWILKNSTVKGLDEQQLATYPRESFDLIIIWHVLEHLPDPVQSLQRAHFLLQEGGNLCVSVPNRSSFQARLTRCCWFHLDVPRHLFHFSREGLQQMLEAQGYEITSIRTGGILQNLYGWWQSLANLTTPKTTNVLYRFLQGGNAWKNNVQYRALFIQIVSSIVWLPLGLLGYILEELTGNYGTITFFAKKKNSKE